MIFFYFPQNKNNTITMLLLRMFYVREEDAELIWPYYVYMYMMRWGWGVVVGMLARGMYQKLSSWRCWEDDDNKMKIIIIWKRSIKIMSRNVESWPQGLPFSFFIHFNSTYRKCIVSSWLLLWCVRESSIGNRGCFLPSIIPIQIQIQMLIFLL